MEILEGFSTLFINFRILGEKKFRRRGHPWFRIHDFRTFLYRLASFPFSEYICCFLHYFTKLCSTENFKGIDFLDILNLIQYTTRLAYSNNNQGNWLFTLENNQHLGMY